MVDFSNRPISQIFVVVVFFAVFFFFFFFLQRTTVMLLTIAFRRFLANLIFDLK